MIEEHLQPKKRGRKPTSKNYFDDLEMRSTFEKYKTTHDEKYFNMLAEGFVKIINGMINKQFYANSYVKNNREDAIQLCLVEIMKSLKHFKTDQKMFPYINRIAKNNLCLFSKKMKKYNSNELIYSSIFNENSDYSEIDFESNVDNISINNDNSYIDDTTELTTNFLSPIRNKTIHYKSSLYIINKYINYLYEAVHYFILHNSELCDIIYNMKYDSKVDFEFTNIENNVDEEYKSILYKIDKALKDILDFLKEEYSEYIYKEPESYDGKLSNRSIGYIRKFAKNRLKKNKDLKKYDTDELVKYLEYIVYQKGMLDCTIV